MWLLIIATVALTIVCGDIEVHSGNTWKRNANVESSHIICKSSVARVSKFNFRECERDINIALTVLYLKQKFQIIQLSFTKGPKS